MNGPVEGRQVFLVPGIMGCTLLWILRGGWIAAVARFNINAAEVLAVVNAV
jgi:hypothetical protein